ncbi:leucine zipper domain-containing protein [Streptomyces canus]
MSCRYFGVSRQAYYTRYCRYRANGVEGLHARSTAPERSSLPPTDTYLTRASPAPAPTPYIAPERQGRTRPPDARREFYRLSTASHRRRRSLQAERVGGLPPHNGRVTCHLPYIPALTGWEACTAPA